jgi:hypothetical protein
MPSPLATQVIKTLRDYAGPAKDAFQIIAIFVGGVWGYFKFFRGRTFRPRLELAVDCQIVSEAEHRYLSTSMQLKNVGLSRLTLKNGTTGLLIHWSLPPQASQEDALEVRWSTSYTFVSAFLANVFIEGGETINETLLLELLPVPAKAYRVVLKVTAGGITWKSKTAVVIGADERKVCGCPG